MNDFSPQENHELSWLRQAWRKQANRVEELSQEWAILHRRNDKSPSFLNKISQMLSQINFFKNEEEKVVSEIEAIEAKHQLMRKQHQLKPAPEKPEMELANDNEEEYEQKPKLGPAGMLALLMMLRNMMRGANKPGPTAS